MQGFCRFKEKCGSTLSPFAFLLSLFLLDFGFRLFHSSAGETLPLALVPNTFTLLWSLLFTTASLFLPVKVRRVFMSVILGFFTFFSLVNAVLYHVSGSFLSFSDLAFAETGAAFISLQYLSFSWKIWLSILLSLFLGVFSVILVPSKKIGCVPFWVYNGILGIVSVAGILFLHGRYYDSQKHFQWTDTYTPGSVTAIYTEFADSNENLMFCGTYQFLVRSVTSGIDSYFHQPAILKSLDAFFAQREETAPKNQMTGVLEGKNAIALMLESIDHWMVTPEIMPNLYALSQKSVVFENHYTPLYLSAGTFNTEFSFNTGLYLPPTGTGAATHATNVYPNSLPLIFRNHGYSANSFHALDGAFYNRRTVHPLWGFEAFYDHGGMNLEGSQICDTTLMEAYEMFCPSQGKFFSFLITYSGHGPYDNPEGAIAAPYMERARAAAKMSGITCEKESTWDQYVVAIAHAMETDAFIGQLLERMKEDGRLEDTALIFFGDHYSKYLTDEDFLHQLKNSTDTNDICRTPFFIYANGLEAVSVKKCTSTVDMLPTIANLFGLEYNARYLIGNDAFGDKGGFVCFKDYSYIDGETYWNSDFDIPMTDGIKERVQEVRSLLTASWNAVKTNYFSKISLE